ncbi:aldo/keto reductase [Thermosinus carboxydivorans Nor1]|uniref:Aldo/keto reductase n=1 Tax=Thermosinus carboxydivorans Nor1 TaxID=401526 RepID=A1HU99_9FIRM|nr:aldo/keto reductase [Thermosinus carboxydivorans]EAX46407.1 aldo/keto reductase [Thermosinus carboxydivorans Nor1]
MEYRELGRTGIIVSRLCFGALTIGPLQAGLPLQEGAAVMEAALAAGVNFIDTAELYQTYPYIRQAIRRCPDKVIIASKSYAFTYEGMRESVISACNGIGRDYIDIFMLHEQTSRLTLKGHQDALRYLTEAKRAGRIRAVGVSTHTVEVVRVAALMDEIDVIHPILNIHGIGICDGTREEMLAAVAFAAAQGKGVYTMKALGGGHLTGMAEEALRWAMNQSGVSAVAVGMQTTDEVAYNVAIFNGQAPDAALRAKVDARQRRLLVEDWCVGCGRCAGKCPMQAITIVDGMAVVDHSKCVLCGYCGAHCPEFCLKII